MIRIWEGKYSKAADSLKEEDKPFTSVAVAAQVARSNRKAKLLPFIDEVHDRLTREKRIGTGVTVKDIRRAISRFEEAEKRKPELLLFTDITPSYLDDFRIHLVERGLAETSMAVYFRTLRLVYNQAIKRKQVAEKHYPFKEFKVSQFDLRTRKRAVRKVDIQAIVELQVATPRLLLAKHLFLFSYSCAGINFVDLAHLQ